MARQWQWTGGNGQRRQRRLGWSDGGSDPGLSRGACAAGANKVVPAVVCAVRQGKVDAQGSATVAAAMVQAGALAAAEAVKWRAPAGMAQEENGEGRRWCK